MNRKHNLSWAINATRECDRLPSTTCNMRTLRKAVGATFRGDVASRVA